MAMRRVLSGKGRVCPGSTTPSVPSRRKGVPVLHPRHLYTRQAPGTPRGASEGTPGVHQRVHQRVSSGTTCYTGGYTRGYTRGYTSRIHRRVRQWVHTRVHQWVHQREQSWPVSSTRCRIRSSIRGRSMHGQQRLRETSQISFFFYRGGSKGRPYCEVAEVSQLPQDHPALGRRTQGWKGKGRSQARRDISCRGGTGQVWHET